MSKRGMRNIDFLVNIENLQVNLAKESYLAKTAAKKKKVLKAFVSCENIKKMIFEHDGAAYDIVETLVPIMVPNKYDEAGEEVEQSMKPLIDYTCDGLLRWTYILGKNGRYDLDEVKVELEKIKKAI
jgi:hypothetical protein